MVVTVGQHRKKIAAVVQVVGKAAVEPAGIGEVSFGSLMSESEDSCPVWDFRIVAEGYCKHQLSVVAAVGENS